MITTFQVLSVAVRNGLKSRAIRSVAPEVAPPPSCSPFDENEKDTGTVMASAEDKLPFPVSIDVACSVLLVPLQRVCMQPACRVIAQVRPLTVRMVLAILMVMMMVMMVMMMMWARWNTLDSSD